MNSFFTLATLCFVSTAHHNDYLWREPVVLKRFDCRDLDVHGFLVEGKLVCKKTGAGPIPYKYVVYKAKKEKYEFEYIYKLDSKETTNRCLVVKPHLLNTEGRWRSLKAVFVCFFSTRSNFFFCYIAGEWHQYDDIICAEPSKVKRFKEAFWPDLRKGVIQGREIAGRFMLETIFDLLRNWSKINLTNFFSQLRQFYEVYGNPLVYEEKETKWYSLEYNEKDVSQP